MKRMALIFVTLALVAICAPHAWAQSTITLQNNVPVENISGSSGSQQYYQIVVPSGQSKLKVNTSALSGNCDLYLKRGSQPSTSSYTAKSTGSDSNESATISNPVPGTWFILLHGGSAYSGLSLVATYWVNATASRWDFTQATSEGTPPSGWSDDSSLGSAHTYTSGVSYDGQSCLKIWTTGYTRDRVKVRTTNSPYRSGIFEWRVYIPSINEVKASSSVGAFL